MLVSRRKFYLVLALLFVGLLYWLWPGRSWRYHNFPPTATGPWIAFGDSLTEGYGASAGADYPAQLSKRLGIPIQNLGVAGETSADGLKRIDAVETLNPRVVLLCFGGNDVLQGVPRNRMFANVGAMIDRLQARGSFVVLIGIRGPSLIGDANAKGFEQLAGQKKVKHVPNILDGILSQPSLMSDYVHPNDAGYARIAERTEKELRPLLAKLHGNNGGPASGPAR
jgi:lysophospholipase L1-like esterase